MQLNDINGIAWTYASLFCGAGGASLGMKQAGGKGVFAVDFDKKAIEVYARNFPGTKAIWADMSDDPKDGMVNAFTECRRRGLLKAGSVDVLQASAPCQDFSLANTSGTRKPDSDKNQLFFKANEFVAALKPNVFLYENVSGLLGQTMRGLVSRIIDDAARSGYDIAIWQLNSADYSCPQDRVRVWIVGVRRDLNVSLPEPPAQDGKIVSLHDILPHIVAYNPNQFGSRYKPSNSPICTIPAAQGLTVIDDITWQDRPMTADELIAASTFEGFDFGGCTRKQIAKFVGLSVLPRMMKRLAEHIRDEVLARCLPATAISLLRQMPGQVPYLPMSGSAANRGIAA